MRSKPVTPLNKWLQEYVPEGCFIHGLRHNLRDRLKAVECPADIIHAMGGCRAAVTQ